MGVAFFPVLERQIDGLDLSFNGKMLAKISDDSVQRRAELLGFKPPMKFFGFDPSVLEEFEIDIPDGIGENWFLPEDGIIFSNALLKDLRENPKEYLLSTGELLGAIGDLERLIEILSEARKHEVKWYLAIDF